MKPLAVAACWRQHRHNTFSREGCDHQAAAAETARRCEHATAPAEHPGAGSLGRCPLLSVTGPLDAECRRSRIRLCVYNLARPENRKGRPNGVLSQKSYREQQRRGADMLNTVRHATNRSPGYRALCGLLKGFQYLIWRQCWVLEHCNGLRHGALRHALPSGLINNPRRAHRGCG